MKKVINTLKENFNLESDFFRYTIRLTISCSIVMILYKLLHLKNGYWAAFSVIACVWPTLGVSLQRTKQRIIGTFFGVLIAILFAHTFGSNFILIDVLLPIFIFLTFYLRAYSYSLYVVFTTVVTIMFICLLVPGNWKIALTRLEMTVLGCIIATAATIFILPSRAGKIIPTELSLAKKNIQQYYLSIFKNFQSQQSDNPRIIQSKTFKNLQNILALLKESNFEHRQSHNPHQEDSSLFTTLEKIYQNLLMLEVHLPKPMQESQLAFLIQPVNEIMQEIHLLFKNSDINKILALKNQLANLATQTRDQRIAALRNISVTNVIFYEHIQWTIFLETLQTLLGHIKNLGSI